MILYQIKLLRFGVLLEFGEGGGGLLTADGDDLLRFVVVEASVAAHLDVNEHVGIHQLGHEDGVLANHHRTATRQHRVVVEFEVVGEDFVEDLGRQRLVLLLPGGQSLHLFPLRFVVVATHIDAHQDIARFATDTVQGNRIDHAAVDEDHLVALHWLVE